MSKVHRSAGLMACLILLMSSSALASTPSLVSYQGILLDSTGSPSNGTFNLTFSIYDDSTGGSLLWTEPHFSVNIADGLFSIVLGSSVPLIDSIFSGPDRWLGISVNGGAELLPKIRFASTPYAHRVSTVDGATGGNISGDVEIASDLTVDGNIEASGTSTFGTGHTITGANTFAAGQGHTVGADFVTIGGGQSNSGNANFVTVGGGTANSADGYSSTIAGGFNNSSVGLFTAIGGGSANIINDHNFSTISGGTANSVDGFAGTISGGLTNNVYDTAAVVGGGSYNRARGKFSVIAGGGGPTVADTNSASGEFSVISGGRGNTASGTYSLIGGGQGNAATQLYGAVLAGYQNYAQAAYSVVIGGSQNNIINNDAQFSLAFGNSVIVNSASRVNFFNGSSSGRFGLNRDWNDGGILHPIHVGTNTSNGNGAYLSAGGVWTNGSSRSFKENGRSLEGLSLLEGISSLDIDTWNYRNSDEQHIGPYAEDFTAVFDVGAIKEDGSRENQYLAAADIAGVALAGVKELIKENRELKEMIYELKNEIESLKNNK